MPEAPELEVVKDVLNRRAVGRRVDYARVLKPIVLRSLAAPDLPADIAGRTFVSFQRRGKFLLGSLSGDRLLVVNPMLSGALQLCAPSERVAKRTFVVLGLDSGQELRYLDDRQMGKVYYVTPEQLPQVPSLLELGPDALDSLPSWEEFQARLRPFHGEIKGILTRGAFIAGIGNAYADEVLFEAGISPFRKRRTLSRDDLRRLHESIPLVLERAVAALRQRMGEDIHLKPRDFLLVHNRGGQPCPRCGNRISELRANQRITSYCRHCQPGMLVRN